MQGALCVKADDMNERHRIANIDDLRIWLQNRDPDEATKIAHRAATRVAPVWIASVVKQWSQKYDLSPLPALRLGLLIGVAIRCSSDEVQVAASAADAAYAGYDAAHKAYRADDNGAGHALTRFTTQYAPTPAMPL